MTDYQKKVLAAFKAVSKRNNEEGASAAEVCEEMSKNKTLSPLDTTIDIADIMGELADLGYIGPRPK